MTTGEGLAAGLAGVECVIDVASGPLPEQQAATEFFTAASRNLQEFGERAGVRIVVVSIIGCDRFTAGYNAAKVAHERAMLARPAQILRAAQFHEFVAQLVSGCRAHASREPGYFQAVPFQWKIWPSAPQQEPTAQAWRAEVAATPSKSSRTGMCQIRPTSRPGAVGCAMANSRAGCSPIGAGPVRLASDSGGLRS